MKGLQLSLNHSQKIRLERAQERLKSLSSKGNSDASVVVADTIPLNYEDGVLKYIILHYFFYNRCLDCVLVSGLYALCYN